MITLYGTDGATVTLYGTDGTPVSGGGGGGGGEDTTGWVTPRHVTTNSTWWRMSEAASEAGSLIVVQHDVRIPGKALRARWGQFPAASTMIHKNLTYKGRASLIIDGTPYRLTFGGAPSVTIGYGESVLSDPLPGSVTVQPGSIVHSVWEAEPGSMLITGGVGSTTGAASYRASGTWGGTVPTMASTGLSGSPTQIIGDTPDARPARSVLILGDSFVEAGWARGGAEANGLAWSDMGLWLEPTATTRDQIANRIGATGDVPFDVIVTAFGGNNSTQSLAEQQAVHIESWRMIATLGAPDIAAMTLHPYTDSTDRWATVEGQTHRAIEANSDGETTREPSRTARNDWIRDGAPLNTTTWDPYPTGTADPAAVRAGETGHPLTLPAFDQADACETARNSGIWKVDGGAWTVDGAHLTPHGSAMLQTYYETWAQANLT